MIHNLLLNNNWNMVGDGIYMSPETIYCYDDKIYTMSHIRDNKILFQTDFPLDIPLFKLLVDKCNQNGEEIKI